MMQAAQNTTPANHAAPLSYSVATHCHDLPSIRTELLRFHCTNAEQAPPPPHEYPKFNLSYS